MKLLLKTKSSLQKKTTALTFNLLNKLTWYLNTELKKLFQVNKNKSIMLN